MELFGRAELLREFSGSDASVMLLVGDSGTGKSAVLAELQARSTDAIAPEPIQVNRAPASLQIALLESMGAAVAQMAEDVGAAQRIGEALVDAASRVADVTLKDLRSAVGRHLLGIVGRRLSPELADLLGKFAEALSSSKSQALEARISAASDNDVVGEIVAFASDVQKLAGGRTVYLALDDLDRLDDGDLRRLADLVNRLPSLVRVRGSFATWHAASRAQSDMLRMSGATCLELAGISQADVEEWLIASGLEARLGASVIAATNGYPVHVEAATALLRDEPSEQTLARMSPPAVLRAAVNLAWRELDLVSQVAVTKLAAFVDRISTERICELLGLDDLAWRTLEVRLLDSGLLVEHPTRWFHELRRRVIWETVLTDDARALANSAATSNLQSQLGLPAATPRDFVEFARVAAENPSLQDSEPGVRSALQATRDEVAIAAAALELVEFERGEKAIEGEALLAHAKDVYGLTGDPIAALSRLEDAQLVHVATNERASAVVPTWGSLAAVQVLIGRAAAEFGRTPVIQLATALFEEIIRPRLGDFDLAGYGVGTPSIASSADDIATMHRRPRDGVIHLGRPSIGLVVRGSHGPVPIHVTVAYDDVERRDQALARLSGLDIEVWDERFVAGDVVAIPTDVVPSLRFAQAIKWLSGRESFSLHMRQAINADTAISPGESAQIRSRVRRVVQARSSAIELMAYGLDRPTGFAYYEYGDGGSMSVEIVGSDQVVQLGGRPDGWAVDAYTRLRLSQTLGLEPGQSIGSIQWLSGPIRKDPLTDEVVHLHQRAASFNRHQRKLQVEFDEDLLRQMLEEAFVLRESDGRALLAALPDVGLALPQPTTTYLVLLLDEPRAGWVPGADALLLSASFESTPDDPRVRFAVARAGDGDRRVDEKTVMSAVFGIDVRRAPLSGIHGAIGGLSSLLGFGRDEVRFGYVDGSGQI